MEQIIEKVDHLQKTVDVILTKIEQFESMPTYIEQMIMSTFKKFLIFPDDVLSSSKDKQRQSSSRPTQQQKSYYSSSSQSTSHHQSQHNIPHNFSHKYDNNYIFFLS